MNIKNKKIIFGIIVVFSVISAAFALCVKSAEAEMSKVRIDAKAEQKFFIGKWVRKGGNPWLYVYTFNADDSFEYQEDDFGMSGNFTYNNGLITLKIDKHYIGGEEEEANEKYELEIEQIDDITIKINGTLYKNIDSIKTDDDWYGNGEN